MARSKVFVSYSHVDREWCERLRTHFAVLEHLGLIETWTDTRIMIGAAWEREIEAALTTCQVAVLLVTPNFLASEFIQNDEVENILERHSRDGLSILPVIARPCAWQLVDYLRGLQCRPAGGRALSLGPEPQIDQDLALLTYEIADLIGRGIIAMAPVPEPESPGQPARRPPRSGKAQVNGLSGRAVVAGMSWRGTYGPVGGTPNQSVDLFVDTLKDDVMTGRMEWAPLDGPTRTKTKVTGSVTPFDPATTGRWLATETVGPSRPRLTMVFTDRVVDGDPIVAGGDYKAVLQDDGDIVGQWFRPGGNAAVGTFRLSQFAGGSRGKARTHAGKT